VDPLRTPAGVSLSHDRNAEITDVAFPDLTSSNRHKRRSPMMVSLSTTRQNLDAWHAAKPRSTLGLSALLTARDLMTLCRAHAHRDYTPALYSLIAFDSRSNVRVWRLALDLSGGDASVANSIATQQRTPLRLLRELTRSRHTSVSQHAELALISRKLHAGANQKTISRLLSHYSGDDGISLGVRSLIAAHNQTPRSVLKILTTDHADLVSSSARRSLRTRKVR
jgi:hypothetical protein